MLKILNTLMAALFLVSAGLQYNDPDPVQWVALYGAAAAACIAHGRGRPWATPLAGAVGLTALAWFAWIAPGAIGKVAPGDLFQSMQAKDGLVEVARESGGLAITAAWMAVLVGTTIVARRRRERENQASASAPPARP